MQTSTTELKGRAKRLRAGIKVVLGVEPSNSQALELVAREENYPNWDAASACADRDTGVLTTDRRYRDLADVNVVKRHVIVTGRTGSGKSTLARAIANQFSVVRGSRETLSVVTIGHIKESDANIFMSPFDADFDQRVARLDFARTVLLIDDCVGRGNRDGVLLELARRAHAAVVTVHAAEWEGIHADITYFSSFFQVVSCDVEAPA